MQLSKRNQALVESYNRGFKVKNGIVYNPKDEIINGSIRESGNKKKIPYIEFSIKVNDQVAHIRVHRLVAYQKFGNKIFENGILVRHLDGNSLNNKEDNIDIGSQSDNIMDRTPLSRHLHAQKTTIYTRKFTDEEVQQIKIDRANGMKYKDLCEKYNTSNSTLSYLFNKALYAK